MHIVSIYIANYLRHICYDSTDDILISYKTHKNV